MNAGFMSPALCAPPMAVATWLKDLFEIVAVEDETILVDDICRQYTDELCVGFALRRCMESVSFHESNAKRNTRYQMDSDILRAVLPNLRYLPCEKNEWIMDPATAENIATFRNDLSALAKQSRLSTVKECGKARKALLRLVPTGGHAHCVFFRRRHHHREMAAFGPFTYSLYIGQRDQIFSVKVLSIVVRVRSRSVVVCRNCQGKESLLTPASPATTPSGHRVVSTRARIIL